MAAASFFTLLINPISSKSSLYSPSINKSPGRRFPDSIFTVAYRLSFIRNLCLAIFEREGKFMAPLHLYKNSEGQWLKNHYPSLFNLFFYPNILIRITCLLIRNNIYNGSCICLLLITQEKEILTITISKNNITRLSVILPNTNFRREIKI